MVEKQSINGKDVWVSVETYHLERSNPNIIPTEYFTVAYYLKAPDSGTDKGKEIHDDEGKIKLFESPVAALTFARKKLESEL